MRSIRVRALALLAALGILAPSQARSAPSGPQAPGPPVPIDPLAQQAYLKASNPTAGDLFGWTVAVSGTTVAVGASAESSAATGVDGNQADESAWWSGAVYVFVRDGPGWSQQAYLKASNTDRRDRFGLALALSGDTLVVGAPVEDSAATGVDGNGADNSAINAGAAYVFERTGTTWAQTAYLKASNAEAFDAFGRAVAVAGDTILVGATGEDGSAPGVNGNEADNALPSAGAAYVFRRSGTTWVQEAYLKGSSPSPVARLGGAVALDGDTAAVGGDGGPGSVIVFRRSGGVWAEEARLLPPEPGLDDEFAASVAVSGDTLLVGAPTTDAGSGAAWVFRRAGTAWGVEARLASAFRGLDYFGSSVALWGDTAVVGALYEESAASGVGGDQADDSAGDAGAAYVLARAGTAWSELAYLKASNTGAGDGFGCAVAVADGLVVAGAGFEDGGLAGVNAPQADDSAPDAGAAYVFDFGGPGVARCFGDGSGAACPCGNASPAAGAGCLHSGGVGMTIAGAGTTSIARDDLVLVVDAAPVANSGLFTSGRTALGAGVPLFDGLQCAGGDVRRYRGIFQSTGTASDTGFVAQDPSGTYFVPAATYDFQYWTRDASAPSPCGTGSNLSPAYAVVTTP